MKEIGLNKTSQLIAHSNNILILGHVNPDGDCIGSMAALAIGLNSVGKNISVWADECLPLKYNFIKINLNKPQQEKLSDFDLIVVLDTAVETRIGAKLDFSQSILLYLRLTITLSQKIISPMFMLINLKRLQVALFMTF